MLNKMDYLVKTKELFCIKGRHVVAARDIPVGEMLVVEEPICSILAPEKLGSSFLHFFWLLVAPAVLHNFGQYLSDDLVDIHCI